jgi:hypothetical protein
MIESVRARIGKEEWSSPRPINAYFPDRGPFFPARSTLEADQAQRQRLYAAVARAVSQKNHLTR